MGYLGIKKTKSVQKLSILCLALLIMLLSATFPNSLESYVSLKGGFFFDALVAVQLEVKAHRE